MASSMNKNIRYDPYVENISEIIGINFGLFGNKMVSKHTCLKNDPSGITIPETYSGNKTITGGILDSRLGVIDPQSICGTCRESFDLCPGHFGHIQLGKPVFNLILLEYVKNILNVICIKCSKVLIKNDLDINKIMEIGQGKSRFTYLKKLVKNVKVCPHPTCNAIVPNLVINKSYDHLQIEVHTKSENEENLKDKNKKDIYILTVDTIYSILRNISDEHCYIMGIDPTKSRPEEMIIDIFPVPPLQVRPSVKKDPKSSSEMDDDLIHVLAQIIKINEKLKENKESGIDTVISKKHVYSLLTMHISTYIDNADPYTSNKVGLRNNKEVKSITARLKGKEGRMRNNLMGKRVNYSARTVITSDPNISIHHVGIPLTIAMILTYSEYVTENNIESLSKLVKNGPFKYPGANYVKKNLSTEYGRIDIRNYNLKIGDVRNTIKLNIGDIVERHLINNDIVLFNRQPSLHKMSMMGHLCHIILDKFMTTFRLNVNITEPYNADFDGHNADFELVF